MLRHVGTSRRRPDTVVHIGHVVAEAVHKVMMTEVCHRFQIPRTRAVRWAQQNPRQLKELEQGRAFASDVNRMQIPMLPVDMQVLMVAAEMASQYGLLTNDAIIVALMRQNALSDLATNDDDFDRVDDLNVWKPA
jgi:predicted nucleic acid-binding protein